MANYRLSKLADKDLISIATYTIERFGVRQASLYRDGLFKAFEMVADFPLIAVGCCMKGGASIANDALHFVQRILRLRS